VTGDTLLVGNPTSQSGRARALIERASHRLMARGLSPRFLPTSPGGKTTLDVRDVLDAANIARVVALGGDGTFAEVARGILAARERRPLGLIPAGTANDQARSFGLKSGEGALEENLDVIEAGHVTWIDAGRATRVASADAPEVSALFFDSVGWGMHPEVLVQRNRDREVVGQIPLVRDLYRDQAVYAGAVLGQYLASWLEPTKFDADALVDGRRLHLTGLTDIIVKATPVYAGAWVLDRRCCVDDGLFELVPIHGRRDWFLKTIHDLAALPVLGDQLDALGVTSSGTVAGAAFELRLSRPARPNIASQLDGEEWVPGDHFTIEVLPRVLPVITRPDWSPPWREA
jgi:diacylglycerol kinase family enzyme